MPQKRSTHKNSNRRPRAALPSTRMGPDQIQAQVIVSHRYRFTSTSGSVATITPVSLLQAMGTCATTTVTGSSIFTSVKISRVSIWSPPASQGAATTCSVTWFGNTGNSSEKEISDTSVSTAQPAHVDTRPPRNSLASFWQTTSSTALAVLTAPTGSIIDVWVSGILGDGPTTTSPATLTLVGATAGLMYYEPLDGRGGIYTPVSLTVN